jgi:hypothetical protein
MQRRRTRSSASRRAVAARPLGRRPKRRLAALLVPSLTIGLVGSLLATSPSAARSVPPEHGSGSLARHLFHNTGARLNTHSESLAQPGVARATADRLHRYLDDAARQGRLLGAGDAVAVTTEAGAMVITAATTDIENLTEQVLKDGKDNVVGYQFRVDTRHVPPEATTPTRSPGLGFATPYYSNPGAGDGIVYTPGQGDASGANYATWHGDVYHVPDLDDSGDFWAYHRTTVAHPNTSTLIDWGVTGVKAEASISSNWRPWFLGRADYQPKTGSGGGCRNVDMNVNLWGFGVPDPPGPVRICGRLDPIPHDNDQYAFGSNWSSGVVFDTDDKTAAASTLVKFYPGVVPVWDDSAFASFCQGSYVTGCDEANKYFPPESADDVDFTPGRVPTCNFESNVSHNTAEYPAPTRDQYLSSNPDVIGCTWPNGDMPSLPTIGGLPLAPFKFFQDGSGCDQLSDALKTRIASLAKREVELRINKLNLPMTSPPGGGRSIQGERDQFTNIQRNLRKIIDYANTHNCLPGNDEVRILLERADKFASKPLPPLPDGTSPRIFDFNPTLELPTLHIPTMSMSSEAYVLTESALLIIAAAAVVVCLA